MHFNFVESTHCTFKNRSRGHNFSTTKFDLDKQRVDWIANVTNQIATLTKQKPLSWPFKQELEKRSMIFHCLVFNFNTTFGY